MPDVIVQADAGWKIAEASYTPPRHSPGPAGADPRLASRRHEVGRGGAAGQGAEDGSHQRCPSLQRHRPPPWSSTGSRSDPVHRSAPGVSGPQGPLPCMRTVIKTRVSSLFPSLQIPSVRGTSAPSRNTFPAPFPRSPRPSGARHPPPDLGRAYPPQGRRRQWLLLGPVLTTPCRAGGKVTNGTEELLKNFRLAVTPGRDSERVVI